MASMLFFSLPHKLARLCQKTNHCHGERRQRCTKRHYTRYVSSQAVYSIPSSCGPIYEGQTTRDESADPTVVLLPLDISHCMLRIVGANLILPPFGFWEDSTTEGPDKFPTTSQSNLLESPSALVTHE